MVHSKGKVADRPVQVHSWY